MKFSKFLIMGVVGLMSLTSCNDWLDVNTNPNNPTNESAPYYLRLAWNEHYAAWTYYMAGNFGAYICQDKAPTSRTSNQGKYSQWWMMSWRSTAPYQWWFVGCADNLGMTLSTAEKDQAWHYVGAVYLIKALGYMCMTDIYGDMPYDDACGENTFPAYNNGEELYVRVMRDLNLAIENLQKQQPATARPLAVDDSWGDGNASKWLKAAYLLKARFINKLTKKAPGKIDDAKINALDPSGLAYDPDAILDCLSKAQQSNADNFGPQPNDQTNSTADKLWGSRVWYSCLYDEGGMSGNYYITKFVADNLTNFAGGNIEDPRADLILPWARSKKSTTTPADIHWSQDGKWRRTRGLDMQSDIRMNNGPYAVSWVNGAFKCNDDNHTGDTVYVNQKSGSVGYAGDPSLISYVDAATHAENSRISGTFHTRPSSPMWLATYAEACFIRAEVLMRKGDKTGAFAAYQQGAKANMEDMNRSINDWVAGEPGLADCPSFQVMTAAEIDNYINHGLGTAGDLTLGKIMTQKHIAMLYTLDNWNDMRRYDYAPDIFLGFAEPYEHAHSAEGLRAVPEGTQPRRLQPSSHEINYNKQQLFDFGKKEYNDKDWFSKEDMWTLKVWWDR